MTLMACTHRTLKNLFAAINDINMFYKPLFYFVFPKSKPLTKEFPKASVFSSV